MYRVMNASAVTEIVIMAAMLSVPFYILWTYVVSGGSAKKGAVIGTVLAGWGAVMTWFCLAEVAPSMGPLGRLVIPVCWAVPTVILLTYRNWFLDQPLSQKWLVGLQVWRAIGGVFLIEMARGNLPGIFAIPAGVGDLAVAVLAVGVLVAYRGMPVVGSTAVVAVIALGFADFVSAFFFGFTSSDGPQQLFHPAIPNQTLLYPTGLIPLFLVPCAIFFHVLSLLELLRSKRVNAGMLPRVPRGGAVNATLSA